MESTESTKKDHHKAVFGIYSERMAVERAVDRLKMEGFRHSDISVLMPDKSGSETMAHEKATKAPEGATTGAGAGLALGGTLGWLVGIGALAIPGADGRQRFQSPHFLALNNPLFQPVSFYGIGWKWRNPQSHTH